MIKAVIFDKDGVVFDTNGLHYDAYDVVFREHYGINIDKRFFASNLGRKPDHFSGELIRKYGLRITPQDLYEKKKAYHTNMYKTVKLKKGVIRLLELLEGRFKIAMATGGGRNFTEDLLTQFNIRSYFEYVVTADDVANAKPDPEIFLRAASGIGVKPDECVVIEDAPLGLIAAKKAGMKCIIVPDELTVHNAFPEADLVVDSLEELNLDMINGLEDENNG